MKTMCVSENFTLGRKECNGIMWGTFLLPEQLLFRNSDAKNLEIDRIVLLLGAAKFTFTWSILIYLY